MLAYTVLVQIMGSMLHIAVNTCNISTQMQPSLNIWHPVGSAAHGPKGVWLVRYGHCDGWAGSAHEAAQCSALSLPPPAAQPYYRDIRSHASSAKDEKFSLWHGLQGFSPGVQIWDVWGSALSQALPTLPPFPWLR